MSGLLKDGFDSTANPSIEKVQKDYPKPISVRFSDEERDELERKAGGNTAASKTTTNYIWCKRPSGPCLKLARLLPVTPSKRFSCVLL